MHPRLLPLTAFLLIAAACGGSEEPTPLTTEPATTIVSTTAAHTPAPPTTADPSSGGTGGEASEFCKLVADVDTGSFDFEMQPQELATALGIILDGVHRSEALAPPEAQADLALLVAAFEGFDEMLGEFDYDLLTIGPEEGNDPRLLAFQTAEFGAAVDNIADLCGLTVESSDGGGSDLPGEVPGVNAGIPPGFPDLLIPPAFIEAFDLGEGAVLFLTAATFSELVEYYSSTIGPPGLVDDLEGTALWAVPMLDGVAEVSVVAGDQGVDVLVVTPELPGG